MSETIETREFTHKGHKFIARSYADNDHGAPWAEEDGHGEVSDWTRRAKKPGEWELNSDRDSKRFYDHAGAMEQAKRDGWGLSDEDKTKLVQRLAKSGRDASKPLTRGEIAAESVRRDFERLRGYCTDQWHYMGISVAPMIPTRDRLVTAIESAIERLENDFDRQTVADELQEALDSDDEYAPEDYSNALWGIESDAGDYLPEVMAELAEQIISDMESN